MRECGRPRKIQASRALRSSADDRCAHRRRCARTRAPRRLRRSRRARATRLAHRRHQRLPGARRRHRREPLADRALGAGRPPGELAARAVAPSRASGARAALLGARGNSGIILSQLVRGACDRLGEGGPLDGPAIADALRRASTEADAALREPVEGTILTVARALADGAEAARSHDPIDDARGGARRRRGRARAHDRTCCRSLRAAGVVDAGGAGLVELVRGALAALRGEPVAEAAPLWEHAHDAIARRLRRAALLHRVPGRRELPARAAGAAARAARRLRSSSSPTASSCARTCTPTTPAARSRRRPRSGTLSGVEISDMHAQRDALAERAARPALALEDDGRLADVLAIVDGDGNRVLYASLGARLLLGGRPTADELLDAIRTSPAAGIVAAPQRPRAAGRRRVRRAGAAGARARRALARARAGPRRARRLSHRPVRRRARRGVRGGGRLGRQRRGARGRRRRRRAARGRAAARSRPAPRSSRCWPARRPSSEALDALADWLRVGPPGRRARAARGRTGAPALLRER